MAAKAVSDDFVTLVIRQSVKGDEIRPRPAETNSR